MFLAPSLFLVHLNTLIRVRSVGLYPCDISVIIIPSVVVVVGIHPSTVSDRKSRQTGLAICIILVLVKLSNCFLLFLFLLPCSSCMSIVHLACL